MVTGICSFRGNCPYVKTIAFFIMEGAEKCMDCAYFSYQSPSYNPINKTKLIRSVKVPESNFYVDNPDFLEIV